MNVILVSSRLPTAKTITLGHRHIVAAGIAMLVTLIVLAVLINYALLQHAGSVRDRAAVASLLPGSDGTREEADASRAYVRDNLDAMALRLGELQAKILRLDTLSERVAHLAGFKPQEFLIGEPAAQGGAASALPSAPLSFTELAHRLDFLARQVEERGDALGLLDSLLTLDNVKKQLLPTVFPVRGGGGYSSNFGWRIDPFSGRRAFHGGIDFQARPGMPIVAAAAGVVVASEYHPQYGNMIEVDHGNGLVTRYAHCSKRLAHVGDVVLKGATIGEVGSTGRVTGPHLHFEVLHRGVPQNPARFLRLSG